MKICIASLKNSSSQISETNIQNWTLKKKSSKELKVFIEPDRKKHVEFVVSFFSGSWLLTLKLSSECHQMTSFLFKIMNFSLKHCPHFEWENLINDDFLMTSWQLEVKCQRKKEPQIQCSSRIFLKSIFWPLKHDFKTETCNFNLSPWILLEPITILLEIYWNPTKVLMEPVGVLLKHSGVLNWSSAKSLKIASFCWNILKRSEKTDQRNYSY